jgi:hypothetical protein
VAPVLATLALAGCGGGTRDATPPQLPTRTASPNAAADCLNATLFLVQAEPHVVRGSAPDGVNFVARFYRTPAAATAALIRLDSRYALAMGATVIDYSGNPPARPGGPPRSLITNDIKALRHCITPL